MERKDKQRIGLKSVFVRCAAIVALTTIVVTATLTVQSLSLIQKLAQQSVVDQAAKTVENQAQALVKPIRFKATPKIEEAVLTSMSSAGPSGSDMIIVDAAGTMLASADDTMGVRDDLQGLVSASLEAEDVKMAEGGLWIARPVRSAPDGPVIGAVAMAWNADDALNAAYWESTKFLMAVTVVFATMMAVALWLFQRVLGRPLREMTATISGIADGDYEDRGNLNARKDEFGIVGGHMRELTHTLRNGQVAENERKKDAEEQAEVVEVLSQQLTRLSERDLTAHIEQNFPPQYENLRVDFNKSVQNLGDAILQVVDSTENIRGGSSEISQASLDLSRRTEAQAATLEETAGAMNELTTSVKSAADSARNVGTTMEQTRSDAVENREIVENAVAAMAEIEQSSSQISQIVGVIDDIAFQTNLLALNAGVEAARAGDSGRGFAVVASEVRALAQRSSEAAMEIKTLISDSSQQVERGVDLVGKAGDALQTIVERVTHVSQLVTGIVESSTEQSTSLNEINSGVSQLDQVTQQNASMVEESTAAGQELSNQASQLYSLVSRFQLKEGARHKPVSTEVMHDATDANDWTEEDVAVPHSSPKAVAAVGAQVPAQVWGDF
ncbi:methyl-accepting chemotaxis protein [Shimia sp. NS0008-38b]|uniref:methyl-accepting chemotaxis protein n=1 Tax=Shimia sp. NS0008-38b TaxID=3127653 RepID=UPI00310A85EA